MNRTERRGCKQRPQKGVPAFQNVDWQETPQEYHKLARNTPDSSGSDGLRQREK